MVKDGQIMCPLCKGYQTKVKSQEWFDSYCYAAVIECEKCDILTDVDVSNKGVEKIQIRHHTKEQDTYQTVKERLANEYGVRPRSYAPINNAKKLKELEKLFNRITSEAKQRRISDKKEARHQWGGWKMREIKFRAWGVNSKEFLRNKDDAGLTIEQLGTLPDLSVWKLQQYTGSKDKNGTEIYEGDIVKWSADILVSVWDYELPTQLRLYGTKAVEYKGGAFDPLYVKTGGYFERCENYEVEIIGNIFENPELMEAGKCEKLNLEVFQ